MNADGSISADMRRKFRQVNRLVEIFQPVLDEIAAPGREVVIVDANCGNAYLGFLLYHVLAGVRGHSVRIHGIDRSPDRVRTCRERADRLGYAGMSFVAGDVATAPIPDGADLLVSLHGCDTATDEAILAGVRARIPHLHVVPCCQKELRPLLRPDGPSAPFLDDGIVAAEHAALLTDVLRSLWLRTRGYRAEILEFVPWEHSLKNRLIRAKFTRRRDPAAHERLQALQRSLSAPPFLVRTGETCEPWPA